MSGPRYDCGVVVLGGDGVVVVVGGGDAGDVGECCGVLPLLVPGGRGRDGSSHWSGSGPAFSPAGT